MSVQPLLNEISLNLTALRKAEKLFAHKLAPSFNLFRYLRNDELGLSRCIADLLDPKGPHGQGTLFLEAFLELLPDPEHLDPHEHVEVTLEHSTLEKRRIDILLKFKKGLIGIENKPWAADQHRQLDDYRRYLEKMSPNDQRWTLVFLSERDPSDESISSDELTKLTENKHYIQIDFKTVEQWLQETSSKVEAPKVRTFVEELANYIKQQIIGELDMSEETEVRSIVNSSDENLAAAVDIVRSWHSVSSHLLSDFETRLKTRLENHSELSYLSDETSRISLGKADCGFYVLSKDKNKQDIKLGFWFENAGCRNFYLGVRPTDESHPDTFGRSEKILERLTGGFGGGRSNHVWIWWVWADCRGLKLGEGFRNWNMSSQPWVEIRNEELVKKVIALSRDVYDALGQQERPFHSAD